MNYFRKFIISAAVIALLFMPFVYQASATAPGPRVSELAAGNTRGNKHNLSARARAYSADQTIPNPNPYTSTNPNTYKATDDAVGNPKGQQVCIFCHTPHNANVEGGAPLWNRAFSTQTFSRYSAQSSWMAIRHSPAAAGLAQYGQPDGSSKLCLSCHDGVASLGAVRNGGPIEMSGPTYISGIASFKPSATGADKMKIGHHPVSFVYSNAVKIEINTYKSTSSWKDPTTNLTYAKLDKNNKMQCTTCHNPHQNQSHDDICYLASDETYTPFPTCDATNNRKVAPFWVHNWGGNPAQDRDNLCVECHAVGGDLWIAPAQPWPK
ncbi:MAG: hypothetical protein WA003_02405 [Desulfuromonadaceae bacterium]